MDVLSDVLDALRLRGVLYFSTEFRPPWGLRVSVRPSVARFHLVVRGSCWVRVFGTTEELVHLETGDLILIPRGAEHVLADTPDTPCRTMEEVVKAAGFAGRGALVIGGEDTGAPTRMICGHFEFDDELDHQLLSHLPSALVIRWDEVVRDSPLEDVFRFITREVRDGRPGHEAVVRRLSEVLFVEAVRVWAARTSDDRGLVAALRDPRLGNALAAMHSNPAHPWTLESLGREAALGRTAFTERFRAVVGQAPLQYLTTWRMQRARRLLAESPLSMEEIAERVGYKSVAAFSRVFTRQVRTSPGAYRRATRTGPSQTFSLTSSTPAS